MKIEEGIVSGKMISIIIPVYNAEKYLDRCIESILNQTITDLEVILVDDGSNDRSGMICDKYEKKDSRVRVIHQANKGVSAARNKGLSVITGEYVGFVDSDDFLDKDMYSLLLQNLIKYEADICACNARTLYDTGKEVIADNSGRIDILEKEVAVETIVKKMDNALWNKLFKRKILSEIRFEEDRTFGEDLYYILQCLKNCERVVYVNSCKYNYIKHENSITSGKLSKKSFDQVYFKDKSAEFLNEYFPQLYSEGMRWSYIARLNLCRKILISNDNQYNQYLDEYRLYLKNNFKAIYKKLKKKEIFEYILMEYFSSIYKGIMTRTIRGRKK